MKTKREPWCEDRQHPYFTLAAWREDVGQGSTLRGYDDWVEDSIEQAEDEYARGYLDEDEFAHRRRNAK